MTKEFKLILAAKDAVVSQYGPAVKDWPEELWIDEVKTKVKAMLLAPIETIDSILEMYN